MVGAAREYAEQQFGGGLSQRSPDVQTILIKNDSGSDVDAFDVLGVGGMTIEPSDIASAGTFNPHLWRQNLCILGKKPNTTTPTPNYLHIGNFAILREPIANGAFGRAVVSGLSIVQLDVQYADHPYADIAHDTTRLTTNWYGAAQILFKQKVTATTPNEWWALVRLCNFESPVYKGVVDGAITPGSSGTVDIYLEGSVTSPLQQVTAYFDHMEGTDAAADNAECLVRFFRDEKRWQIVELAC